MSASFTQLGIPDEQLQSLIQGLEHLILYESQYKENPNLPLEYNSALSESYRQWKEYFTAHLTEPLAHQTLCASLERARRGDLREYVQKTFLVTMANSMEPETSLDQMLQNYVTTNSDLMESVDISRSPAPAPVLMPTLIVEPDAEILRSQVRSLRKRIRELEEESRSFQRRLAVKEGERSWDEVEQIVAEYERRAQEAEAQLEAALAQSLDKSKNQDDREVSRKAEKKYQKTLVEVTSLASGMLNHLTTFLNDKACMVEPGEKVDPIQFAEFQAPLIQMIRKLKRIEEVSKLRCGVTEVTELIDELFGEQRDERKA